MLKLVFFRDVYIYYLLRHDSTVNLFLKILKNTKKALSEKNPSHNFSFFSRSHITVLCSVPTSNTKKNNLFTTYSKMSLKTSFK
jgi:hypothetical protein